MPCKAKLAYARHEIGHFAKRGLGGALRSFRSRAEGFSKILEAFESAGKLAGFVGIKLYPYRGRRPK